MYIPQLLYLFICPWTSRLLPCSSYCNNAAINIGVHASFSIILFSGYLPSSRIVGSYDTIKGFPGGTSGKQTACQCRRHKRCGFDSWVGKIPWRRKWQPTPIFLPGKFHGQRSLGGLQFMGFQKSQTQLSTMAFFITSIVFCCKIFFN